MLAQFEKRFANIYIHFDHFYIILAMCKLCILKERYLCVEIIK